MTPNKLISTPSFYFTLDRKFEFFLREYIKTKIKQEISGGLIGDIKGGKRNQLIFDVKTFLPFPNLAENKLLNVEPPKMWFDILEEWRLFYYKEFKFIGFLHTHPISSSKLSEQDKTFATFLQEKYGTIIFIVVSENKTLRSYVFNKNGHMLISGTSQLYKVIIK